jgi:hypothetical protein
MRRTLIRFILPSVSLGECPALYLEGQRTMNDTESRGYGQARDLPEIRRVTI